MQKPVAFARQAIVLLHACAHVRAVAGWPQGKQECGDEVRFHGILVLRENATGAKAAHDTRVVFDAQLFFNIEFRNPDERLSCAFERERCGYRTARVELLLILFG